jgi:hypothetical protein
MDATNEVISSLKFIGKLKKGDKINTKFMYTQPDGMLTRIYRTLINHDNRTNALNFLQRTIHNSFEIMNNLEKSSKLSDYKIAKNIIDDLKNAKNGLTNIRETYSGDLKFNCDVSTLLQYIDSRLEEVEDRFSEEIETNLKNFELKNDLRFFLNEKHHIEKSNEKNNSAMSHASV